MKNYFQKIITLFTGNDYPESTQQDFYKWLVDEEHTVEKDEALQKLWDDAHKRGTAADMQESYELLKKNAGIPSVPRKRTIRPIHIWQTVAAVLFIVAASSVYLSTIGKDTEANLIQQYIPTAEIRTLTLPDGTQVQLNSQSTLLYPQNFTGKDRSVFLIGEANFKVKPDKRHPFIVKSNDFQVTAFNVSAYPENPVLAATLISGSVLVEYNDLKSQVILKPNEQLAYNKDTRRHCLDNPDMKEVTAWQRGELVLQKMTLRTCIQRNVRQRYNYSTRT
mgnify:CR=1 FL=1